VAGSFNPVDAKKRAGGFGGKEALEASPGGVIVVGYDGAGVVEEVGGAVSLFKPGDAVYFAGDVQRNGAHAE
jgi:NADPH2:quinone reductase